MTNIRRAAIAAALAYAVLVPSGALAWGGGGHFGGFSGGGHSGFTAFHQGGAAGRFGTTAHLARATHRHQSSTRLGSRKHRRIANSNISGTGNNVVYRPPRGDRPSRGSGHHPPRGPIVTVGTPGDTPVTTSIPPTTGAGGANPAPAGVNGSGSAAAGSGGGAGPPSRNGFFPPPAGETRYLQNEVLLDIAAGVSSSQLDAIARRLRLTRLDVHPMRLVGRSIHRWRINDGSSVATAISSLAGESRIAGAQPNYLFAQEGADDPQPAAMGDPAQYVIAKLHLADAHRLATGERILVALIDSGIDTAHPDLAGTIAASFDVLGPHEVHFHGTAMAGAIAAHGRLMGVAPGVRLLAVRSLDAQGQGTSLSIADGIEWAVARGARVINMSFAGPNDPLLRQHLTTVHSRGIVMVAAAGNEGPASAPLYPAADAHVIAVTATDADDRLYALANRGHYIAVAAPGVDVLEPAPNDGLQLISGTSVAAAHVSGIAALVLERTPTLGPDAVRSVIMRSAAALSAPEARNDTGAGLTDAFRAVESAETAGKAEATMPVR
ncbi:MAG: S8 family serine peptidase [Hyphomicrobiales bacterium]|nr:S8 family serine peptidase [Hyphomicrobiales bacterium]MBV8824983.1 S8 family serine peptidase [Hyphomicrobiales bacterium]